MKIKQHTAVSVLRSENGAVLVIAMMILVVLTIIGVAANNTSVLEILVSNAAKNKQAAFHAAEAGIDHGRIVLSNVMATNNPKPLIVEPGMTAKWNFLFETGSGYTKVSPAHEDRPDEIILMQDRKFGDHTYTVTVWPDDANADGDIPQVFVRSVSEGPQNSRAAIEVGLLAQWATEGAKRIMDYSAQDKSGAGKGSTSNDTAAISAGGLATSQLGRSI